MLIGEYSEYFGYIGKSKRWLASWSMNFPRVVENLGKMLGFYWEEPYDV